MSVSFKTYPIVVHVPSEGAKMSEIATGGGPFRVGDVALAVANGAEERAVRPDDHSRTQRRRASRRES